MTGLGYRAASHSIVPAWRRWVPLARHEFEALFRTRWGVVLFLFCLVPGVARLVMLLILSGVVRFGDVVRTRLQNRAPGDLDPDRIGFYVEPVLSVMPGMVFFLLLSSAVVARAIARDRSTNALELLWTRGISPRAYLLAKWLGPACLLATTTVLVPFVLWSTAVLLADDWTRLFATAGPMAVALSALALVTAIWIGIGVLLSALPATGNAAIVLWTLLIIGSKALGFTFAQALREPSLISCISVWDAGGVIARALAGLPQSRVSVAGAGILLFCIIAFLAVCARRRLRLEAALA